MSSKDFSGISIGVSDSSDAVTIGGDLLIQNINISIEKVVSGEIGPVQLQIALVAVLGELKRYHELHTICYGENQRLIQQNRQLRAIVTAMMPTLNGDSDA